MWRHHPGFGLGSGEGHPLRRLAGFGPHCRLCCHAAQPASHQHVCAGTSQKSAQVSWSNLHNPARKAPAFAQFHEEHVDRLAWPPCSVKNPACPPAARADPTSLEPATLRLAAAISGLQRSQTRGNAVNPFAAPLRRTGSTKGWCHTQQPRTPSTSTGRLPRTAKKYVFFQRRQRLPRAAALTDAA